jgi:erythrocyte band 7 integral membrane protein
LGHQSELNLFQRLMLINVDFEITPELENELNSAPRARRAAQSSILSAQADVQIAKMLADRSKLLDSNTAMQIRYLDPLKSISSKDSCKVIYTPGHH